MRGLTVQEEKAITAFKECVRKLLGDRVVGFRLFGSRARGEGNEESDVDVLVLLKEAPAAVRGQVFEISADIFLKFEIDISPLVMSERHYEDMKKRERLLPLEIEREGRAI